MITSETKFLQKIADFTKIALGEIEELELELHQLRKKEAADKLTSLEKTAKYSTTLEKAAEALYDTDFLTDDFEKRKFLKLAKEDPTFVAETLIKVCKAADVSLIGTPARVATKTNKAAEYDPVAARAFGYSRDQTLFDE